MTGAEGLALAVTSRTRECRHGLHRLLGATLARRRGPVAGEVTEWEHREYFGVFRKERNGHVEI